MDLTHGFIHLLKVSSAGR
uniref:Uncharacterized protein n=1 Tax=Anguilla anguilla TaxID=7936 RepID=A0A0E9PU47_ANGAN